MRAGFGIGSLSNIISMPLETILKDSAYRLTQFSEAQMRRVEKALLSVVFAYTGINIRL
jgi:hypothetical protein